MTTRPLASAARPHHLPRLLSLAALCIAAATLGACKTHTDGTSPDAATRPIPENGPKRPADLTPPPAPVPGHTAR
jgi:hypothetical protein